MRALTFSGFLESYTKGLAGEDTRSLSRLVQLMQTEPRLTEPLLLWAATTGRSLRLQRLLASQPPLVSELQLLVSLAQQGELEASLAAEDQRLRPEYVKAWKSYTARRDAKSRDERLKLAVRDRVLALEMERHVTRYRMAKDLGLNPGNLHAFLALGEPSKISLDRAFELLEYLKAA